MDIRKEFLKFFKKNDHLILPSSGLIPDNDASVLLTTAGMQQFKPFYLGSKKPPHPRIATVQKCFRTSDIDRIGDTDRHLTFFEMLGNFAFADYFKEEAISFASDFILNILKIPEERLWFTVFGGYKNLPLDIEAKNIWLSNGIKPVRIIESGMKDNFWGPAGDTGPCGPSTEIYYDFGEKNGCGKKECSIECDCGRFVEIWNLVFTQYNFNGTDYDDLPNKNIDTGLGLERIYSTFDDKMSVFNTPLFAGIFNKLRELSGKSLNNAVSSIKKDEIQKALKIIADHSRAIYFLITDGVVPSNEGRGYILRRIIRRAVRFARVAGINDYFLNEIGKTIISEYKEAYPELEKKKDLSFAIVDDEEKRFSNTLKEGTKVLLQIVSDLKREKSDKILPQSAFKLYDTYGFPVELTNEILAENKIKLDLKEFEEYSKKHIELSKEKTVFNKKIDKNINTYISIAKETPTFFEGYERISCNAKILAILNDKNIRVEKANENEKVEIILDKTSFYGEKGGELGDRGEIKYSDNIFVVEDTIIPVEGLYVHKGFVKKGIFAVNNEVAVKVDLNFRNNISRNHTSTHLLHWALRTLFGKETEQAGSMVSDEKFRFDYRYFGGHEEDFTKKIEDLVNKKILENNIVKVFETTKEYADEIGSIALFGEKYAKFVRVVEIGDFSRELCGGIHVKRTGDIGVFKIISDTGIGANLRRIEAITGNFAFDYFSEKDLMLKEISDITGFKENDIISGIKNLKDYSFKLSEKLKKLASKLAKNDFYLKYPKVSYPDNSLKLFTYNFSNKDYSEFIDIKFLGEISDEIKSYYGSTNLFMAVGNSITEKPFIILNSSKDLVEKGINCSKLAKDTGRLIKGGGGGKPDYSQIGGSDNLKLDEALNFSAESVKKILK